MNKIIHFGSSPMIEVASAVRIWSRTLANGLWYRSLVSEGHLSTRTHWSLTMTYKSNKWMYQPRVTLIRHGSKVSCLGHQNDWMDIIGKYHGSIKYTTTKHRNAIQNNIGHFEVRKIPAHGLSGWQWVIVVPQINCAKRDKLDSLKTKCEGQNYINLSDWVLDHYYLDNNVHWRTLIKLSMVCCARNVRKLHLSKLTHLQ